MEVKSTIEVSQIPIIDIASLVSGQESGEVAEQIRQACCDTGFFYIVGHGIDTQLQQRLEDLSHQFFAQDLDAKMQIRMALGGRAWRGFFPVGGELTSGKPDLKEGIYFGSELDTTHPAVQQDLPMHGANLFPGIPGFRETILEYLDVMTELGHTLMRGIALSLGLEASYFRDRYTTDPLILFRIFNYPPDAAQGQSWGVGEHTDYGLLTILKQDDSGGLQVKSKRGWIDAPPISNSFVCNIGDMLERLTGGIYRSTPHRVKNVSGRDRLSFPFFFDPSFDAELHAIEVDEHLINADKEERWDKTSVHEFHGTYGDYVLSKVSKVFPELHQEVL
ncbi:MULTISPECIES: isopenicillin N synthase family oxygenase [unclassified Leptolyngbya]|uniref:isopenicillin N synthase family dioxygenase n=1 Tax=unclassified Leptolyngbya TaxID=2650499 RepID=UPI0016899DBA|nr:MULTISPECIES: isopenicillin N synthase family oxygenase [unclassified Leptolyngbya]MBD1909907.1 isopenicillin N synthase family oxygenase [Leptolyngbya sp. FACHB-8]MBD2158629.1 isopenicillin N synthase family oxygenase [Leptolyngbya sp. FACHB-16]